MAVKYVTDFEFPSDFGFQKNSKPSVPGKARGGHATTPQKFRDGGKAQPPQSKYMGHSKHSDAKPKTGAGASNLRYGMGTDKAPPKTTMEKSSGMQSPAFGKGGKSERNAAIHKAHMARKARGGSISPDIADAPVPMGKKSSWNKDDAVSPGSDKRTPPKQGAKNDPKTAKSHWAVDGENTSPATKQEGDVERMSGWSDFKKGGKVHKKSAGGHMDKAERKAMKPDRKRNMGANPQAPGHDTKKSSTPYDYKGGGHAKGCGCKMCGGGMVKKAEGGHLSKKKGVSEGGGDRFERGPQGSEAKAARDPNDAGKHDRIKNLGHYAHGGKVYKDGSTQKIGGDAKYEKSAGTPKRDHKGSQGEVASGNATGKSTEKAQGEKRMAGGGLTRGTSARKNAAIHAKSKKGPGMGALAALAGNSMPKQPMAPGMGSAPPGMAPGMGSPPGGPMGGMSPPPGLGARAMAHGGGVKHVMIHHISHKAA